MGISAAVRLQTDLKLAVKPLFTCLLFRMLHARSFDQPQITGSLNQITQSIRKSYLCLFVRCETQLSHQGSGCQ